MGQRPLDCCAVVELRRYTLHPGRRDELIELFDGAFVEGQEQCGIHVIGQFRDADDAARFVWLRGFTDMEQRRGALEAFYTGAVWRAHRDAANATMIDSDDVLLLRPISPADRGPHVDVGTALGAPGTYTVEAHRAAADPGRPEELGRPSADNPNHTASGAPHSSITALLVTRDDENTFPALPVRRDFAGTVVLRRHRDEASARAHVAASLATREPPEIVHVLSPTQRSALQ